MLEMLEIIGWLEASAGSFSSQPASYVRLITLEELSHHYFGLILDSSQPTFGESSKAC